MRIIEGSSEIASKEPIMINSFEELVKEVAILSFRNKDYLLFYRGQNENYVNQAGNSSFYPSIYRTNREKLSKELLGVRFKKLDQASNLLIQKFVKNKEDIDGSIKELKNRKYIRWSILQHYEVCDTPLLDLTQSVLVASSFALINKAKQGYFYVFALPYITNRISINSEHDIVNIRLINICPPQAYRPYFQEGYLVGTDDITTEFDERVDLDFKHRLIGKYQLINEGNKFWDGTKSLEKHLKPARDPFDSLCKEIKEQIDMENNIELMFPGKWLNRYIFKDGREGTEIIEIRGVNEYYIKDTHIFNLDSIFIDKLNRTIEFRKVGIGTDKRKAFNSLKIINENLYEGIEDSGTQISYSRII